MAIKRVANVFKHKSDAIRILREMMLLRHLKHPDIVEIKHVMLPPSPTDFDDIYIVFELMDCDLHQVGKTPSALVFFSTAVACVAQARTESHAAADEAVVLGAPSAALHATPRTTAVN